MRLERATLLLELARKLASTPDGLTLDEMADALGVHRRTAQRMRDALAKLFPQMDEIADGKTKRFRIANGLDGLFQSPEPEELSTLAIAADAFKREGASARASALASLEAKVRSAMRSKALAKMVPDLEALVRAECIAVQAGPRPAEDESLIATIRQAVLSMRRLAFRYAGGSRPGEVRTVVPYGLLFGRSNYLVGAEPGQDLVKHWRLDRMSDLVVCNETGTPPAGFDIRKHSEESFGIYRDQVEDVVLRFNKDAAAEAERWRFHPAQSVSREGDGSIVVTFRTGGMLELAWHLFTWGDRVTVEGPLRLKAVMRDEIRRLSEHHLHGEAVRALQTA